MTNVLDDVTAALIKGKLGQTKDQAKDWFIYQNLMQDSEPKVPPQISDNAICLYETPGRPPETYLKLEYPSFQVKIRCARGNYDAMRTQLQSIYLLLHANVSLGDLYTYCYSQGSAPLPMGTDEKRRQTLVWNFRTMRTREDTP